MVCRSSYRFVNTIEKNLALFRCNHFSSLLATTTLIKHCSCSSDSATITVPYAYLRLLTTVAPILKPSMSPNSLIIVYVYKANTCGKATHHCRTPCMMLVHALMSSSHLTAAVYSSKDGLTTGVMSDQHPVIVIGPPTTCALPYQTPYCSQ